MSDLALKQTNELLFDLDFNGSDLALSDSMQGAVALSLGCFIRSGVTGVANLANQLGGWWGNALNELPMGSEIWKLFSRKVDAKTADEAAKIAEKSLAWMVTDGVAKSIEVTGEAYKTGVNLSVRVNKPDGTDDTFVYQVNWEASV